MKSTRRALRRHHRQRMIQRALRAYVLQWDLTPDEHRQSALRWYNNLARCSCWMCGNPRRHEGRRTHQEQRQHLAADEEMILFLRTSEEQP